MLASCTRARCRSPTSAWTIFCRDVSCVKRKWTFSRGGHGSPHYALEPCSFLRLKLFFCGRGRPQFGPPQIHSDDPRSVLRAIDISRDPARSDAPKFGSPSNHPFATWNGCVGLVFGSARSCVPTSPRACFARARSASRAKNPRPQRLPP